MTTTLRLGFTGTQQGMNARQRAHLVAHLKRWSKKYTHLEIHHGDCIGADAQFHELCLEHWPGEVQVVLHPPTSSAKRAFCTSPGQLEMPKKDYLKRNHEIVAAVDGMLAAPKEENEQLRSGTWATVRHSRKTETPLIMLYP